MQQFHKEGSRDLVILHWLKMIAVQDHRIRQSVTRSRPVECPIVALSVTCSRGNSQGHVEKVRPGCEFGLTYPCHGDALGMLSSSRPIWYYSLFALHHILFLVLLHWFHSTKKELKYHSKCFSQQPVLHLTRVNMHVQINLHRLFIMRFGKFLFLGRTCMGQRECHRRCKTEQK